MNTMEKDILSGFCGARGSEKVIFQGETIASIVNNAGEWQKFPIQFEAKTLAHLEASHIEPSAAKELAQQLAPIFHLPHPDWLPRMLRVLDWVSGARALFPEIANWVGIYQKESALFGTNSSDLLVGPYLGEVTDHIRIPINRGFCGLALREERTVNVKDVNADSRHIACSWKTKSELVIPLQDKTGKFVAELDIDSHKLDAFSPAIETAYREYCAKFSEVWR